MPEDDIPLAERLVPKRTAAKQASTAWKDLSSSDEEEADVDLAAKKRRKPVASRGRKRTGSTTRPAATKRKAKATVEVPTPGPSTPKAGVGRGQDPVDTGSYFGGNVAPGMDYDSDLTPLPSPERDPVKASGTLSATLKAQVQEHPMFASFSSDTAPLVLSSRPKATPATPKPSGTRRKPAAQKKVEDWSLDSLGRHVWVLLDGKDNRTADIFDPSENPDLGKDRLWWPATVKRQLASAPLKVQLFGSSLRVLQIESPSSQNVLSRLGPKERTRFSTYEDALQTSPLANQLSPRKKQKLTDDHKQPWEDAVQQMQMDAIVVEDDSDDDLDSSLFNILHHQPVASSSSSAVRSLARSKSASNLKGKEKSNKKRKFQSDSEVKMDVDAYDCNAFVLSDDDLEDADRPPLRHGNLDIPGELVLAREPKATRPEYWPAKLEEYIPPKRKGRNKEEEGRYRVKWFDNTSMTLQRSCFYTQEEEDFATCKMGKIDHRDREVVNDHEEEEHRVKFRLNLQREPSPQRSSRIPPPNKFTLLGARAQFAYTKPVLQAILKDEYAPIRAKRQALMRGGKDAFKVTKMSTRRGLMDPRFVEDLGACVSHWCLREQLDVRAEVDEGEGDLQVVAAAEPSSEPVTGSTSDTVIPVDEVGGEAQVSVSVDPPSPVATELVEVPSSPVLEPPSSSLSPFPEVPSSQIMEDTAQGSDPSPDLMEIEPTVPESVLSSEAPETVRDAPTPASTRQIGSPDYEDLHDKDKLSFCLDILLPEAIRQILLFWSGKRTSPDLLSPEEEQRLFNDGEELLNQRDWVWDVLRVRETKEKIYERKLAKRSGGDLESANSRAGRTRKKVNYGDMC